MTAPGVAPRRVAVVADGRQLMARVVVPALLARLADDPRVEPIALLVPGRPGLVRQRVRWVRGRWARRRQLRRGTGRWDAQLDVRPTDLPRLAREAGAHVLRMRDGDPNRPEVVAALAALEVDVLVNVGSLVRLGPPLLACVGGAVNLHDGALPRQRGIGVGAWAIHGGAPSTAATFHRVTAGIDEGPVLVTASVPVLATDVPADLALRTALTACGLLSALVDAIVRDDAGRPQTGIACVHDRSARRLATHVPDAGALTAEEWWGRLRAFGALTSRIADRERPVTGVAVCPRPSGSGEARGVGDRCGCGLPGWRGADGVALHVVAIAFRPVRARSPRGRG